MSSKGKHRCCLSCYLIQTQSEFKRNGCPNCGFLDMRGSADRVLECTTTSFDGAIAILRPEESWVAKFQRAERMVPGVYAARSNVQLSGDDQELAEQNGRLVRGGRDDD